MKVTYKKTLVQRITDEKALAAHTHREIDYVTVDPGEWDALMRELCIPPGSWTIDAHRVVAWVLGVEVRQGT